MLVDGKIYKSCDHYYQICKVTDLTGISSDKLNSGVRNEDGKLILEAQEEKDKKAYSAIAKEIIKAAGVRIKNLIKKMLCFNSRLRKTKLMSGETQKDSRQFRELCTPKPHSLLIFEKR